MYHPLIAFFFKIYLRPAKVLTINLETLTNFLPPSSHKQKSTNPIEIIKKALDINHISLDKIIFKIECVALDTIRNIQKC